MQITRKTRKRTESQLKAWGHYLQRHPPERNVFVMLKYSDENDTISREIELSIGIACKTQKFFNPVLAKEVSKEVEFTLEEAAIHCAADSNYGIAVFADDNYNSNVAFELGLMWEKRQNVLLLRSNNIPSPPFAIVGGQRCEPFDIENVGKRPNDLIKIVSDWLKIRETFLSQMMNYAVISDINDLLNINHLTAIKHFEKEINKCLDRVASEAKIKSFNKKSNLREKVNVLYNENHLTVFMRHSIANAIRICGVYKDVKKIDENDKNIIFEYADLLRNIFNHWWSDYNQFLSIQENRKKMHPNYRLFLRK